MGILAEPMKYVRDLKLPKGFRVIEMGDQYITASLPKRLAKDWYTENGCGLYVSIDANGRGDHTYDLNLPLPASIKHGTYDLVTDFGTGEHVFNQHQFWKSLHHLTKLEGHIVFDKPAQGYHGHCFYNYHETFFMDLAHANKYVVRRLERKTMPRGELIRGVFQKRSDGKFHMPYQGRYRKSSQV